MVKRGIVAPEYDQVIDEEAPVNREEIPDTEQDTDNERSRFLQKSRVTVYEPKNAIDY